MFMTRSSTGVTLVVKIESHSCSGKAAPPELVAGSLVVLHHVRMF